MQNNPLSMKILFSLSIFFLSTIQHHAQTPYEIIERADSKLRGASSYTEMSITTVRPKWEKKMTLKGWSKGADYSVSLVLERMRYGITSLHWSVPLSCHPQ